MTPINNISGLFLVGVSLSLVGIASAMTMNSPEDYVCAHNKVRSEVGIEPLSWNETLAEMAQKYANTKIATCEMAHSGGPEGENLAQGYEDMSAETAVELWADEKQYYDHDSNTCGDDPNHCLHYTQIVWKDTTTVGCGQVKCDNNWVFVVCNYHPPGNYIGYNPY